MAENENLASILVKSGLISIFTNSPIGYFSKFANEMPKTARPAWVRSHTIIDSYHTKAVQIFPG